MPPWWARATVAKWRERGWTEVIPPSWTNVFEMGRCAGGTEMQFETKQSAREWVWDELTEQGVARFPFPVTGRIPNFSGAEEAAARLVEHPLVAKAQVVKVNPDSPQRPVREALLRAGKTVVVPTPRLKAGFMAFDPAEIADDDIRDATMISRWKPHARKVALDEMPDIDVIVTGCVAVTEDGKRAGKGHGYSDLEYAILRELGQPPVPVVTTVHDVQMVDEFPVEDHDVHLSVIATPTRLWEVASPGEGPEGLDWELLDEGDVEAMPVLGEL